MKLTAKVTGLERDKERGVLITGNIEGGGYFFKVANPDNLALDDELVLLILTKEQAAAATDELHRSGARLQPTLRLVYDQLRPDAPPPFLDAGRMSADGDPEGYGSPQPDTAETAEFRLGGTG